jgi:hypothetical protein
LTTPPLGAFGLNNRSFVSTSGNDSNSCTPGSECRSFTRAMQVTNPGGEIIAENSGGYGPFTINQAVTVAAAPGAYAAITSASDGIDVSAGTSDRVVLSGLHINLTGAGCSVNGGQTGIAVTPSTTAPASVKDSVVRGAFLLWLFDGEARDTRSLSRRTGWEHGPFCASGGGADGVVSAVDFVADGNTSRGLRVQRRLCPLR